jgi:hypothetical protein
MSTALRTIDQQIVDAAIRAGFNDASVVRQSLSPSAAHRYDAGEWFCLSVKYRPDGEWELLGRRRSRGELLEMVNTKAAI